jgi:hypothetical protein
MSSPGLAVGAEARLFYTLFSALEFLKIFRGGWEKNKNKIVIFSLFAHLAKWAS